MSPFVVDTPTLAEALQERLAPWLTSATDPFGDHAKFLTAVAAMGQPWWSIIMDAGDDPDDPSFVPGYGQLFDVDLCPLPYLPFLAQMVGVPPSALLGADDATARSIIRNEAGQKRGTPAAVISAAQRNLTGGQYVLLLERTNADGSPNPYHVVLIVRASESGMPVGQYASADQSWPLIAAVEATKPAGIQATYVVTNSWTVGEMESAFTTVGDIEAAFATVGGMELDSPGH